VESEVIKLLLDKQTELLTEKLDAVVKAGEDRHHTLIVELKTGFPEGKLEDHRIAHEKMMKDSKWREDMKVDAQKKVLQGGIGAIFAGLGYIIIDFLRTHSK
jgi:hypothetical protein